MQEPGVPAGPTTHAPIEVGDLVIDRDRFLVTVDHAPAELTFMEFQTLYLIACEQGRVATYDLLCRALWGDSGPGHRRRLAVLVSRLRSKLGEAAAHVQTVRQVGYRIAA